MLRLRAFLLLLSSAASFLFAGCGGMNTTNCMVTALNVTPQSAVADHTSANGQMFSASNLLTGSGVCTGNTSALVSSTWTASDPTVHFSPAMGPQVMASCTTALAGPVTITATAANGQMLSGQARLMCN